jgi:hypothetical protein
MKKAETKKRHKRKLSDVYRYGKDEMNLVEYSFASASHRADRKISHLVFEDEAVDPVTGKPVLQRLTTWFSSTWGRPTIDDDQIYVGLQLLTKKAGFVSPKVFFTRYELLKAIGWQDTGPNYDKVDKAFNRLRGVGFDFDNAFYDNAAGSWVDRKFSLIASAGLYTREKYDLTRKRTGKRPKSWFRWSDELFESFVAGYIRTLDMEVYRGLENDVAKKLYRYAGKRLWGKERLDIRLDELAETKLGFKAAPRSHLLRMLKPAFDELQDAGIFAQVAVKPRGTRDADVTLWKGKTLAQTNTNTKAKLGEPGANAAEKLLINAGVKPGFETGTSAGSLARDYPADKITRCAEHWHRRNTELRAAGKAALKVGYLIASIRSENDRGFVPEEFETAAKRAEKTKTQQASDVGRRAVETKRRRESRRRCKKRRGEAFACYERFSDQERLQLEDKVLEHDRRFSNQLWRRGIEKERLEGAFGPYRAESWLVISSWRESDLQKVLGEKVPAG